ncbi:GDSL-type esterase/lipase family protein [Pedobacter miscanthi]|jgi:lysophospholipase L1-like esterase|uniref:GDSL-type esterase/lipase family protein n=1 Tax=Pedobacter miscanthi TaxID=2259170 RepID=UPI00292DB4F9|nr:GDSL-type esterase/lipase family protein [Pedobacter miscanthi]
MKKIKLLIVFCCFFASLSMAQEKHRFFNDVQVIKSYDKIYAPAANPILFIGSSSIRRWSNLQSTFGAYNVLNRGIGGAVIDDVTYYLDDLLFVYQPRQVVIYVGENDIPIENESPEIILEKTITLYKAIRSKLPEIPVVYISLKPSPVRDKYQAKCIATNKLLRSFFEKGKNTSFADVFTPMLKDGKSRPELFVSDMLHMKPEGYKIWEKVLKPKLLKPTK